jgi:hypothetical protein
VSRGFLAIAFSDSRSLKRTASGFPPPRSADARNLQLKVVVEVVLELVTAEHDPLGVAGNWVGANNFEPYALLGKDFAGYLVGDDRPDDNVVLFFAELDYVIRNVGRGGGPTQ